MVIGLSFFLFAILNLLQHTETIRVSRRSYEQDLMFRLLRYIDEEYRREGYGSMLLEHVCSNPNRTYVLLTEVAKSDSDILSVCVRRKIFYLKNGFRTVPIKWRTEEFYKYDVHVKGPDLELGSLLAVLRKGDEIWHTAYIGLLQKKILRNQ